MCRESWAHKRPFNLPPQFSQGWALRVLPPLCGLCGCIFLCMYVLCGPYIYIYVYVYMYLVSLVGGLSFFLIYPARVLYTCFSMYTMHTCTSTTELVESLIISR